MKQLKLKIILFNSFRPFNYAICHSTCFKYKMLNPFLPFYLLYPIITKASYVTYQNKSKLKMKK